MIIFVGKNKQNSEDFRNLAISEYERIFRVNLGSFSYSKNNKPMLENAYISITHTKDIILVAISNKNVGIDVEDKQRDIKLPISIQDWTYFEAYAKWTGQGINREILNSKLDMKFIKNLDIDNNYFISIYSEDKEYAIICL